MQHQARKYGVTKFGISRFLYGFFGFVFYHVYGQIWKKANALLWWVGYTYNIFLGFMILLYLSIAKLFLRTRFGQPAIVFLGILLIIVGFQLFITGFIAELVTRNASDRNQYKIEKQIWTNIF